MNVYCHLECQVITVGMEVIKPTQAYQLLLNAPSSISFAAENSESGQSNFSSHSRGQRLSKKNILISPNKSPVLVRTCWQMLDSNHL